MLAQMINQKQADSMIIVFIYYADTDKSYALGELARSVRELWGVLLRFRRRGSTVIAMANNNLARKLRPMLRTAWSRSPYRSYVSEWSETEGIRSCYLTNCKCRSICF